MASFHDITTAQLRQMLHLKERIEYLQGLLSSLRGGAAPASSGPTKGKRTVSAATKKKMAAAQQARYAKAKDAPAKAPVAKKKGGMTPEGKAKIAAAMKARWAAKKKVAPTL